MYLINITNQLLSNYHVTSFPYTPNIRALESGIHILGIHNNNDNRIGGICVILKRWRSL
jgi:hypothetical protein